MHGLFGCATRLFIWAWIRTDLTLMYGHMLLKSLLALKGWRLIDLNLMLGQINIELSVDVLLKRRVYV